MPSNATTPAASRRPAPALLVRLEEDGPRVYLIAHDGLDETLLRDAERRIRAALAVPLGAAR